MSKEHVFGAAISRKWPLKNTKSRPKFSYSVIWGREGKPVFASNDLARKTNLFNVTVSCVCPDCNNGWMGSIDEKAAPLIVGLSRSIIDSIDYGDLCRLADFAYLKSMIISSIPVDRHELGLVARDIRIDNPKAHEKAYEILWSEFFGIRQMPDYCSCFLAIKRVPSDPIIFETEPAMGYRFEPLGMAIGYPSMRIGPAFFVNIIQFPRISLIVVNHSEVAKHLAKALSPHTFLEIDRGRVGKVSTKLLHQTNELSIEEIVMTIADRVAGLSGTAFSKVAMHRTRARN